MAQTIKAANKQIDRLKKQLTEMKEAAAAKAKTRASSAATRRALRIREVGPRIAALKTAIAAAEKAMASAGPKTAALLAKRITRMEKAIEKLQVDARILTVYNVRLLENEQVIGEFGPYATIRAASADAKNILRMHLGPSKKVGGKRVNQIEEIGVDEPLLRSDGKVWVYFHPSIYSGQQSGGPVLTAQVVETGGKKERTDTFIVASAKAKKPKKKKVAASTSTQTSLLPNPRAAALEADAHAAGYHLATYSPGDGKTRYRFFALAEMARRGVSAREQDYFGPLNGVHTAMGLAAAKKWLARAPSLPRTNRRNPARGYVCVNDRYCPQPDTFTSLASFQAMCKAVFGERAHLTRRGSDYVDERGQVVLRSLASSRR